MAHVGQELALGPVCHVGLVGHFLRLDDGFLQLAGPVGHESRSSSLCSRRTTWTRPASAAVRARPISRARMPARLGYIPMNSDRARAVTRKTLLKANIGRLSRRPARPRNRRPTMRTPSASGGMPLRRRESPMTAASSGRTLPIMSASIRIDGNREAPDCSRRSAGPDRAEDQHAPLVSGFLDKDDGIGRRREAGPRRLLKG